LGKFDLKSSLSSKKTLVDALLSSPTPLAECGSNKSIDISERQLSRLNRLSQELGMMEGVCKRLRRKRERLLNKIFNGN
jgi:hypothetical protein